MSALRFSAYDFFGYLISGMLVLVSADYLIDQDWLKGGELTAAQTAFWAIVAYACGHVLATPSQVLLERFLTRRLLGHPTALILGIETSRTKKLLFPGYSQTLPDHTCKKILSLVPDEIAEDSPEAVFYEAYSVARTQSDTAARMDTFLNLYGFSRNIAFASLVVLLLSIIADLVGGFRNTDIYHQMLLVVVFVAFFYRYLKFYRLYSKECLMGLLSGLPQGGR